MRRHFHFGQGICQIEERRFSRLAVGRARKVPCAAGIKVVIAFAFGLVSALSLAADIGRGRSLYEVRCDGCHTTGVHLRASRKAEDFSGVRSQVERWNAQLGGAWSAADIDDVTVYLNDRFYRYPCPSRYCDAGTARRRSDDVTLRTARADGRGLSPAKSSPRMSTRE